MTPKYYQESGAANHFNFGIGIALVLVTSLILGYIYALLVNLVPIIYLNVMIAIGFGIALSFCIRLITRLIKNRNKRNRIILTILAIIFFTYFQWVAFVGSLIAGAMLPPLEYLGLTTWITVPQEFFGIIGEIYKQGTWQLGLSDGIPMRELPLLSVWIVEIILIALPALKHLLDHTIHPFSEQQNKWYPKYILLKDFESMASSKIMEAQLNIGALKALKQLEKGSATQHSKVHLYYLDEEQKHYLSIDRIFIEKRGEGKTNRTSIIENYCIDTENAKGILTEFKNNQERINVF
ncbi:MAG: hypothetical protein ACPGXL_00115 [Chitinophagales bacterium]